MWNVSIHFSSMGGADTPSVEGWFGKEEGNGFNVLTQRL